MNVSAPFTISIRSNLISIVRDKQNLNLFRQLTLTEIDTFRKARRVNGGARPSPFSIELEKLNALIRLLRKNPINLEKVLRRIDDLALSTKHFLDFETKKLLDFELSTMSQRSAAENHMTALTALENTRKYFREPSGSRYSTEELNLARKLVNIYETASGDEFGVGSSSTTLGPDYMTPSEQFLFAALKLANKHTTIEGMRELYRAAHRQKKGSKKPAAKNSKAPAKTISRLT